MCTDAEHQSLCGVCLWCVGYFFTNACIFHAPRVDVALTFVYRYIYTPGKSGAERDGPRAGSILYISRVQCFSYICGWGMKLFENEFR